MHKPSVGQVRALAVELLESAALELAVGVIVRRLDRGRDVHRRGKWRRAMSLVLRELVTESANAMYWQRRRIAAAFDQHVAARQVETRVGAATARH